MCVSIYAYRIPSSFGSELYRVMMKKMCIYGFFKYIHPSQNFPDFETTLGVHRTSVIKIVCVNNLVY